MIHAERHSRGTTQKLGQFLRADHYSMPLCRRFVASLLLGTVLAAPLSRSACGLAEPICASDLETKASQNNYLISLFESSDHAALCSDWPTSRERHGRIDTHQHYVPQFYADYLEKYSAGFLPLNSYQPAPWCPRSHFAFTFHTHSTHLTQAICRRYRLASTLGDN